MDDCDVCAFKYRDEEEDNDSYWVFEEKNTKKAFLSDHEEL